MAKENVQVAVPQSIQDRMMWGKAQKDKNVVYRTMHLIRENENLSDSVTVMITRYPHGDFGYMVSIDGYTRYATQVYHASDIVSEISRALKRDKVSNIQDKQEWIDLIAFTLQDLLNDYFKVDKKTGSLKMI